ncbi:Hemolysin A OS=Tsukamurella paurometabola (strain ATCC 8368 / DSM / CCUG 35730 / CIP 100753/ JCM 10117 / KCTC 9821 / NBRC 16120 / NCIMB 702349 / NCTC 13040)OX=521096 GN=Tpau_2383 PE=3 SV=1 [Tsukamurella paurometabola]|uniref:Hemolysin A n=1 Tax=Tsukamurella paurometabola (strain ATCC 8368 / DSM 20162 / CCUG 35730 / CIP 100753 / JCM 10117 / KCTC 9821 / NBRC 16120 / NCIMB 702349 / NCTC 13040) TaxID=521096 RepID=D5UR00_TSUPD|nr:TlyA family RNA methyltransferase [Tsukamurella paurometabola]ADG78989.1 hemolysin A [Tsukamurella paurometabola DSM 20162]SUP33705.1 16S/23S rRNA (cytidine-2'-O)-methyltransferase TlyA [Tsukamurella paurometabola]
MARRVRLDAELVRRGMARSREQARELIESGRVTVNKQVARKAANQIDPADPVHVTAVAGEIDWASRGAHKLIGALDAFPDVTVAGRRCLDAGASTGGFTDVLLHRGAERVYAVDVGYGELVWRLRDDARVTVMDRTNVRTLEPGALDGPVDLVVGDLSFISLSLVLPAMAACTAVGADLLPMIKPQFEVGKGNVGSGGVVRDPQLRASAVLAVARTAADHGLRTRGVTYSPLPGPSGNVEYFLWLRREDGPVTLPADVDEMIATAVAEGPQ